MKAGSAGSNPDDNTKTGVDSQPLKFFLNEIGSAVFFMNTAVVGLDAVENGHQKPHSLNISWNPINPRLAAIKTRRFILNSILIRVAEALDEYVTAVINLPQLETIKKSWESNKDNQGKAKKLEDIVVLLKIEDKYLLSGTSLLIHWRNRIVHRKSNAKLSSNQLNELMQSTEIIKDEFSGLCTEKLLKDFQEYKPTLKDISSLIAMSIKLIRKMDEKLHDVDEADLDAMLKYYGLDNKIQKIQRETSPSKCKKSIIRLLKTEAPQLIEKYEKYKNK